MKQPHVFIDDYGDGYWRCHYTKQLLHCTKAQWIGSMLPQANYAHAVGGDGWKQLWRYDRACFADMDRNCNSCTHLIKRVPMSKKEVGLSAGICNHKTREPTPYAERDGNIVFAPQDWMGMSCFENRYASDLKARIACFFAAI